MPTLTLLLGLISCSVILEPLARRLRPYGQAIWEANLVALSFGTSMTHSSSLAIRTLLATCQALLVLCEVGNSLIKDVIFVITKSASRGAFISSQADQRASGRGPYRSKHLVFDL